MTTMEVFDPPQCCPTGVCGPQVDPKLVRFAADLEWLQSRSIPVQRHGLAQDPAAFAARPAIALLLAQRGTAALPAILVGGALVHSGGYPSRAELARWAGLPETVADVPAPATNPAPLRVVIPLQPAPAPPQTGGCCSSGSGCA